MRKTTKKKTIAATAFLLFLIAVAFLIPHFLVNIVDACWRRNHCHPPLGKWIYIQFTCGQSGKPIVGLPVTIGIETVSTNVDGWAGPFGSGFGPGTYTYTYSWWDGPHSGTVTIDCSKRDWYFYVQLVNPEIHKTFLVDSANQGYPPIEGLDVTLVGYGAKKTDANGYVSWVLDYPFGDYTLEWTWNGKAGSETAYWADFVDGVWTQVNNLQPKSLVVAKSTLG